MKTSTSTNGTRQDPPRAPEEGTQADFESILEWARLWAADLRGAETCAEKHREILSAQGEPEQRLSQLDQWRISPAFTEREKAALALSESVSLGEPNNFSSHAFEQARGLFSTAEMVCLTLAIVAVNDWINLHSETTIRILIVEDDPQDQELLRRQLRLAQMEDKVRFVSKGSEALEVLAGPDGRLFREGLGTIILDLRLPDMGGIGLLRRIRELEGMEDVPVLVMTSSNRPEDLEECHRLKVAEYLKKPVTYSSFSNAVANIFSQVAEVGR